MAVKHPAIALLGGTFDPIHNGHLQTALELYEQLPVDQVCLLPAHRPPHREAPGVSSADRLRMVELATADQPNLIVDPRELTRDRPSYTVDTLAALRREHPRHALIFAMGTDAFLAIDTWHQWPRLLQLGHLVICQRPGWHPPAQGVAARLLEQHAVDQPDALCEQPAGAILPLALTQLAISATAIRHRLDQGLSCQYLMPPEVIDYIRRHKLYRR